MKKIKNLRIDFYEAMRRFHDEGFGILGAFVFGFDYENKDVFEQTLEFIMRELYGLCRAEDSHSLSGDTVI